MARLLVTTLMLKDLKLAQQAAQAAGAATPLGAQAAALFQMLVNKGSGPMDFSVIFRMVQDESMHNQKKL
jgi:3-hydroxyisobutyrate dehydrogenase